MIQEQELEIEGHDDAGILAGSSHEIGICGPLQP